MAVAMWRKTLSSEGLAEYIRLHAEPWPELLDEIRRIGIRNYSIFIDGNEAIGYFEHDDLEALSNRGPSEVLTRWNELMGPLSADPAAPGGGTRAVRNLVFHLD